jgi:hypothetical protein
MEKRLPIPLDAPFEDEDHQEATSMADVWYQYKGNGSIFVLDNYHPYRNEVVRYLDLIGTTYSGKTLFRYCNRYSGRRVQIRPFVPTPDNPVNSGLDPLFHEVFASGQPMRRTDGSIVPGVFGTGAGSDVTVRYHPANQRQFVANMHAILPGSGPGEALFHELVHAMRAVHGAFLGTPVPESSDMKNFEEFCAVTAANVYRSERGFKIMRDSHRGFKALDRNLSDSDLYYDWYKDEFTQWFNTQRDFCLVLAKSNATFNPFKSAAIDLKLMAAPQTPMALGSH